MARHHTFDDVVNDELDYLAARVLGPIEGLCHDSRMLDHIGVRIGHVGSSDAVAICTLSQLGCKDGARDSFKEVIRHCLLERSRVRYQSWEDVSLEHVVPSADLVWAFLSIDPADIGPDHWREWISWVEPKLKRYRVVLVEVTVSSSRKGRIALGLPEKMMPGGKAVLPSRGIVVLVEKKKSCAHNMV